jgi:hypothetical protein
MDQGFSGQWRLLGLRIGEQSKAAIITAEAGIARGNSLGKRFRMQERWESGIQRGWPTKFHLPHSNDS